MSTTIDEKVVSMQFDNSNFERNVQKTLGTINTLQQALDFKNADKSFKGLESAAANLNFDDHIFDANTKITASFDAMSVFAINALTRISNKAIDTGKNLVKSLSVDQLSAGWTKYGQKTESVQTLVNSTGKTVEEIDKYLARLMWFSDETSYSFTEMTTALGSMTATGGNIDELIPMLMGMANATAYAGKGANEFSRVIYNLNQSYGQGYLSMMDWRSVQNAGVASQALMEQMIEAAKEVGTLDKITSKTSKGTEVSVSNFASTLSEKWATSEVMLKAFGKFSELTLAVEEAVSSGEFDTASEAIQALAGDYDQLAVRAFKSAQEAKSLAEAIDATKDAVSSGFMSTIEAIFGNYTESKTLWTDVANTLWDIFASGAEARNELLGFATDNSWAWDKLVETISGAGISVEDFETELKQALTNAEYDVDDLIARYGSLGRAISHIEVPIDLLQGVWRKFAKNTEKYNNEEIKSLHDMQDAFGDTEVEVKDLFKVISSESGRLKIADSIGNLLEALQTFANIVSHAISSVFGEIDSDMIYNLLDKIQKFTEWLIISGVETDEATGEILGLTGAAKDVADAFGGVLSVIKLVFDIVKAAGGAVKDILGAIFGDENGNLLSFVGKIGSAVTSFVEFVEESEIINTVFSSIASLISGIVTYIWDIVNIFRSSPAFIEFIEKVTTMMSTLFTSLNNWIQGIKTADNPISYILTGIISGAGDIVKFGLEAIGSLWDALQETIRTKAGLAEDESVGGFIVKGLIDGIRDAIPLLVDIVMEVGREILNTIKDVLGIHSPSTEAAEVGHSLISGLWEGIQTGVKEVLDDISGFLADVLNALVDAFNNLDTDKILTATVALDSFAVLGGSIATVFTAVSNITAPLRGLKNALDGVWEIGRGLRKAFSGLGKMFKDIGKGVKRYLSAKAFGEIAFGIAAIAVGIALILGALYLLTKADYDELQKRVLILLEIMAAMVVLMLIMKVVSSNSQDMAKVISALKSLGMLILLISVSMLIIGKLSEKQANQGMNVMLAIFGMIAAIVVVVGVLAGVLEPAQMDKAIKALKALGKIVKNLGIAMILMAVAMKIVGGMDTASFIKGAIFMGLFAAFLAVLMLASKKADPKTIKSLASVLRSLSITLIVMAIVLKLIGSMSWGELARGLVGIAALLGFMLLFVWGMKTIDPDGKKFKQIAKSLSKFSIVLLILAIVLKLIGSMSWGELARGLVGIAALMGFIMLFVWGMTAIDPDGKKISKIVKSLVPLSICLLLLTAILKIISGMSWGDLAKGLVGLAALMGFIMLFVWGMTAIDPDGTKIKQLVKSLFPLSVALLLLSVTLKIIASLSWGELARGLVGIAALMGFIMLFVYGLSSIKGDLPAVTGVMLGLSLVLILMSVTLLIISGLSWEGLAKGLVGIGALVLMLLVLVNGLKLISKDVVPLTVIMAGLILLVISMAVAIRILAKVPFEQALGSVVAMSVLVLSLSAALLLLSKTNAVSAKSIIAIVVIIAVAVIFALLLKLIADIDTISAATNLILIGAFILMMTIVMAAVSIAGPLAVSALVGLAGVSLFIAALIGILELLSLVNVDAIDKAGNVMESIGKAIGKLIGGVIGGIGEGIANSLPVIAEGIATFIETINSASTDLPDVGDLIGVIKDITGLSFKKLDSTQFSSDLEQVAKGICTVASIFAENKDLLSDTTALNNALAVSEIIKNMSDSVPKEGGLLSGILGSKDMDSFGESIKAYGESIGSFAVTLNTYKSELKDTSVFEAARDAGLVMNELNEAIPKTGGIVQSILGESDLAEFGLKLVAYGTSLGLFAITLNTYKDLLGNIEMFDNARDVGLKMNEVNEAIPKTGGIVQSILGESDLAEFGLKLVAYGTSLGSFGTTLNMYHDILADQDMFMNAAAIGVAMAGMEESIPKEGGWVQKILGKSSMDTFGSSLEGYGEAIGKFGTSLKSVDFTTIEKSMPQINTVMETIGQIDTKNPVYSDAWFFSSFSDNLEDLARGINAFDSELGSLSYARMLSAMNALSGLFNTIDQFGMGSGMGNFKTFADAFVELADTGIDKFVAAFDGTNSKVSKAAEAFISSFKKSLVADSETKKIKDAANNLANTFANNAKNSTNLQSATQAGKDLVQGFINGIQDRVKGQAVYEAAKKVGRKGVEGIRAGAQEKSPSKAAMIAGEYLGEGFIIGIDSYGSAVEASAYNLGSAAVNNINNAVANARSLIENSVDSQPTIRPVLDLSEIQAGANQISGIFASNPYLYSGSRMAGSISRSFIGQNGRNYDMVSAIQGLSEDIVNNSGDSYVINGVSYTEGSDVGEAIKTLANAIVVGERR